MSKTSRAYTSDYPQTHWPLVVRAGQGSGDGQRKALAELLRQYLPALKYHLIRHKHVPADRAEDLLQGFVCSKILEQGLISRADRAKGKFRTFILTALDHYVVSQFRYDTARKRAPALPPIQAADAGLQAAEQASADFDVAWGREIIAEAIKRMRTECEAAGRADIWGVFQCRILAPILDDVQIVGYDELIRRFAFKSSTQASNALITAKRKFARILRSIISQYARNDGEIDEEIFDLKAILANAGA